jgi:hypothetical protein
MVNANLFMAIFWLFLGAALIIAQGLRPDVRWMRLCGTDLSIGWAAIVLCVYNLVRWWSLRSYEAQRRALDEAYERRLREAEQRPLAHEEHNPDFDFGNSPPSSEKPRPEEHA